MTILVAEHISKIFKKSNEIVQAVVDVSLKVGAGEIVAFLGPNGAGKTTSIKMMAGLIHPDSGTVLINGDSPKDPKVLRNVGAVLEGNRNIYWRLTVRENLEYFGALRGMRVRDAKDRGQTLIEEFQLDDKADAVALHLSRGMQQKLAVAIALMHEPQLLLLDEPTLALDVEAVDDMIELVQSISSAGKGILITTHQLDIAQRVATKIVVIQDGKIILEDSPSNLMASYSTGIYTIHLEDKIPVHLAHRLENMGARLNGLNVIVEPNRCNIYDCLKVLRTITLGGVTKDTTDLTTIFKEVIKTNDGTTIQS